MSQFAPQNAPETPAAGPGRPVSRAREALLRIAPPAEAPADRWERAASLRRRSLARPWEGGHSVAWLIWVLGGIATTSQTTNPLYLAVIWGCATLVWSACALDGPLARAFGLLLALGGYIFLMHIIFSVISAGFLRGQTVIFTAPVLRLPRLLGGLELGGAISLEQVISGAARGLRLWTLLVVVGAFNACANHYRLLRRTPRFLFHVGLVVTIGLAFVPQTILRLRAIREAQRLRGHRFRSWRDALPLFVPLLSGGLERSLGLAEAMEARGYGRTLALGPEALRTARRTQWLTVFGLGLLMLGTFGFLFYPSGGWASRGGLGAILGGGGLIMAGWWRSGQALARTAYIRERWAAGWLAASGLAAAAPLLVWWLGRHGYALEYRIFPKVGLPPFEPLVALPLLALAAPALLTAGRPRAGDS